MSVPARPEEIRVNGACTCGRPIVKILNSQRPTLMKDGSRFIDPSEPDKGWCLIRCEWCNSFIPTTWIPTEAPAQEAVNG